MPSSALNSASGFSSYSHSVTRSASPVTPLGGRLVKSIEVFFYLSLRDFLFDAVTLLNLSDKLIALTFNHLQIAVGQLAPFLLNFACILLPLAFHLFPVHKSLQSYFGGARSV